MNKIIYFDGVCNLCNWAVRFVLKHDKKSIFSFASLQSDFAENHFDLIDGLDINLKSVIYQDGPVFYFESDAVLQILKALGGFWSFFYVFKIIPKPWRDWIYRFIARHRYQWFGKQSSCMIPPDHNKSKFLD